MILAMRVPRMPCCLVHRPPVLCSVLAAVLCFLSYARHKFRAALGAAKALPRSAEVLLLVDGSGASLVLLDMLHFAQTQNTFKRLHCNARVLYIDACGNDSLSSLHKLHERYAPFEFYVIQLNAEPKSLQSLKEYSASIVNATQQELRSLTARQDYGLQQRKRLIGAVAAHLQCSHVFESSISSTLATQLLTSVALGRGGSVALDVALLDDRLQDDIKLLRPLKDLNEQEVQFYVHAQQLQPFTSENELDQSSAASLQNLTSAFVANLQINYASTVSTIFRTGDKIAAKQQTNVDPTTTCTLCHSVLDHQLSDTLLAIEYSRAVSEMGVALQQHDNMEALEQRARQRLTAAQDLCHACRNIQAELTSGNIP
ncbi:cytoplasmic tRNA 2-thiolation protein 2 isoform X2 [Drosophila grimshawi]|uniref:cytoplasmic tRNA 2-thiolation protein 2 isoform X2 n=1 Tax=Drosophila grimshawi TaxID=7222 RepID=UPI000C870749|nr:cytoplasmic tRNA 2-thiolation protein 2 isoform X2 [Drosophila grimshawi]